VIRGIRLEGKKEATLLVWTLKRFDAPAKVRIFLKYSEHCFALPIVQIGDKVKSGEKIAKPANPQSVPIHASMSGTITAIETFPHPVFGKAEAVEIETDKQDHKAPHLGTERRGWDQLSAEEVRSLFQDSGLVDLNPEMEPLHLKTEKPVQKLIINACEAEPYLTSEHALLMSHPVEILKGVELLRKAAGAESVTIVTQDNKVEAAELLKSKIYFLKWKHVEVRVIPSVYPAGTDKMLRRMLSAETPSYEIFNVATAYAVYEAVALQKPLIERALTLGGECFIEPKNVWARVGTEFETLTRYAKNFLRPAGKMVMNGPMAGQALEHLKYSLTAGMQGLLALPEETVREGMTESCIRSGRCVEVCPVEISPVMIALAAEKDWFEVSTQYGADACIECGNCTYICPSKKPLVELIRYAKGRNSKEFKSVRRQKKQLQGSP
jgi:Na+-translocating ferredoxin:NAD+ oxidoreductase subunit C